MGFLSAYARGTVKSFKGPKPRPAMGTAGGVTHRLRWLDRHSGYRMGCSCGWADPGGHWSEDSAVMAGNSHIRTTKRVARSTAKPKPTPTTDSREALYAKGVEQWNRATVVMEAQRQK